MMSSDPATDPAVLWMVIMFLCVALYIALMPHIFQRPAPSVPPEHRGKPLHHLYQHYKGGVYLLLTIAVHEATKEQYAVYQSVATGVVYTRPLELFQAKFVPYSSNIFPTHTEKRS